MANIGPSNSAVIYYEGSGEDPNSSSSTPNALTATNSLSNPLTDITNTSSAAPSSRKGQSPMESCSKSPASKRRKLSVNSETGYLKLSDVDKFFLLKTCCEQHIFSKNDDNSSRESKLKIIVERFNASRLQNSASKLTTRRLSDLLNESLKKGKDAFNKINDANYVRLDNNPPFDKQDELHLEVFKEKYISNNMFKLFKNCNEKDFRAYSESLSKLNIHKHKEKMSQYLKEFARSRPRNLNDFALEVENHGARKCDMNTNFDEIFDKENSINRMKVTVSESIDLLKDFRKQSKN